MCGNGLVLMSLRKTTAANQAATPTEAKATAETKSLQATRTPA